MEKDKKDDYYKSSEYKYFKRVEDIFEIKGDGDEGNYLQSLVKRLYCIKKVDRDKITKKIGYNKYHKAGKSYDEFIKDLKVEIGKINKNILNNVDIGSLNIESDSRNKDELIATTALVENNIVKKVDDKKTGSSFTMVKLKTSTYQDVRDLASKYDMKPVAFIRSLLAWSMDKVDDNIKEIMIKHIELKLEDEK